jgi:hypothetical protein
MSTTATATPNPEVAIHDLAPQVLPLAQAFVKAFSAAPLRKEHDWDEVTFAPAARYVHDPAYQNGAAPAYVELRLVGQGGDARGYMVVSLSQDDYPVPEFATRGGTKTDALIQAANGAAIHKFVRFGPAYIVGEDAQGQKICSFGTVPAKAPSQAPPAGAGWAASLTPAANYADLKADFANSAVRAQARALRSKRAAPVWRAANGVPQAVLQVQAGHTLEFMAGRKLSAVVENAARTREVVSLMPLPDGGFRATGLQPGQTVVRVQEPDGTIDHVTISVTPPPGGIALRDQPLDILQWIAGTDWDGDERQYDQIARDIWCPYDGCGPTALAMLLGWWDVNGVPSAFYRLDSGRGKAHNFRFNYESLRDSDAPKSTADHALDDSLIVPIYDDLHALANTICFPTSDQGATAPDQLISAFKEYVGRIADPLPAPQNEYGERFVELAEIQSDYAPLFLFGETNWEGGGKMVARGIQNGVPGVVGIGQSWSELHYPLAYGYMVVEIQAGSEVTEAGHYFKCNMGHGPNHAPEYHHAEDVWMGLTARLRQRSFPQSPNDTIAATFAAPDRVNVITRDQQRMMQLTTSDHATAQWPPQWTEIPAGVFVSGPAACVSADGKSLHVFGRGEDHRAWRAHSPDGGATWDVAWAPIGAGTFTSALAAAISADGKSLHVFGRGTDNRIWRAHSPDGGANWDVAWAAIGSGVFTSAPAAAISADGKSLHVFGRGQDNRFWRAHSRDGGANWELAWAPIGDGTFVSSPAAAISADGQSLHVFGRGMDNRIWRAHTPDGGAHWDVAWAPVGDGVFVGSPAAAMAPDGKEIHVFGIGTDSQVWRAFSLDGGGTWALAWDSIGGSKAD